jgi:hypothetical protein
VTRTCAAAAADFSHSNSAIRSTSADSSASGSTTTNCSNTCSSVHRLSDKSEDVRVHGDFELTTDELRVVARFVAETADELLPVFEDAHPGDPRPRAAQEASTEASRLAAQAAGDAASAAYLHPIADAHQVGHILRAAANAARVSEINASSDPEAAAEMIQRARQRATPALTDILLRYPPAPTGNTRVAQLMATLDTVVRTSVKIRVCPSSSAPRPCCARSSC